VKRVVVSTMGTCAICLEVARDQTACGHHFHVACLAKWLRKCTTCPVCRRTVSAIDTSDVASCGNGQPPLQQPRNTEQTDAHI